MGWTAWGPSAVFLFSSRRCILRFVANPARSGELIGQKLGKYELLALIAVGGTAEIYLARITGASGFEKYLVVKCLLDHLADDQEFVRMFLDEARIGAQLDHSNIVQTLELGEQDGRYYLVIEYLAGMSVAQMARKTQERRVNGGLIDTNLVLGMASQTCNGLHYAHRKTVQGKPLNLIHRDISPQNLVVSYEGILKIVDFGIAKSDIREAQTRTGTIKGKFAYMSPEQCLAKKIDNRTDIFALGTLTHELLTGRRLFKRQTTYDTYQAIVNGVVPKPSEVNPKLDAHVDQVIMKALAYDPDERYATAQAFGEALLGLLHKRNGSGGAGDISQFFEDHFHEDLAAHAEQMREFITGKKSATKDATWDQEFGGEGSARAQGGARKAASPAVPAPRGKGAAQLSSIPAVKPPPRKAAPVHLDDDYGDDDDEDDEGPTRIEFDPEAHMAEAYNEDEDSDDGWDDEGPTKIGGLDGSAPGMMEPSPSVSAPSMGAGLPPVPRTDPSLSSRQPQSPDFAKPPETINVSQLPAHQQQPPRQPAPLGQPPRQPAPVSQQRPTLQRPAQPQPHSQPHSQPQSQQQSQQQPPRSIASDISNYQGQQANVGQPAGSQPVQLGGQAPVPAYPSYSGGSLPIAAQGSGALINNGPNNPYQSGEMQHQRPGPTMPATMPNYPATSLSGSESSPLWMHIIAFALCAGVGVGVAALIKMLF